MFVYRPDVQHACNISYSVEVVYNNMCLIKPANSA